MASGSKSDSVFTRSGMGSGPSAGLKRSSIGKGDTDLVSFPQDNVHGVDLPNTMGGKMGGSVTNLSHSLEGTSAVQRSKGKPESSGI
jgi:hypothetical protein